MKKVERVKKSVLALCLTLVLALGMLIVPAKEVLATSSANASIQDAKNAVVQIMVCVQSKSGDWYNLVGGTGFLIGTEANSQYVVTNDHVANATSTFWRSDNVTEGMIAISEQEDLSKVKTKVRVVLKRDSYIDATIVQNSSEADLAILKLEQPIYNRKPVVLDNSGEVQSTQKVYALGFPGVVQSYQDDKIYTSDDVTVTDGTVSKVASSSAITGSPITYINHSASIADGNSGGPLLNESGAVIGVNDWTASADTTSYYYSIQISEVTDLLDAMGIDYMKSGDSLVTQPDSTEAQEQTDSTVAETAETSSVDTPEVSVVDTAAQTEELMSKLSALLTEEKGLDISKYTKDSAKVLTDAIAAAEDIQKMGNIADADSIQKAMDELNAADKQLVEKTGPNWLMIGVIGAVVLVVIIIAVVLIVVLNGKKKKEKAEAERKKKLAQQQAMSVGQGGFQENRGFAPRDTSTMNTDAGDTPTGILNEGSENTTVLSNANMPTATLIRKKTNERVTIHQPIFKIGKERRKVDYCVSDNSNISRSHADIVFKNGKFYVTDNNATNGTSVNGNKVQPGTEYALTGNDTIRLADEDFLFRC